MEDERVPLFERYFERAIKELEDQEEKKQFGKGSLLPRRRTYGKRKKNIYYMDNT